MGITVALNFRVCRGRSGGGGGSPKLQKEGEKARIHYVLELNSYPDLPPPPPSKSPVPDNCTMDLGTHIYFCSSFNEVLNTKLIVQPTPRDP